jgi:putative restriction endonuclease
MTPLELLRVEKAAAACGFEMSPQPVEGGLKLRSALFPEQVVVTGSGDAAFVLRASNPLMLDAAELGGVASLQGYAALYEALSKASARARTLPNRVAEEFRQETASLPRATEAERLVVQRVGQGLFRSALLDFWQGRCCVTGLALPELLRASHIKPWADCASDDERLDVFNGLLLAPHLDALFDAGLVTFDDDGAVLVSAALPSDAAMVLGVSSTWRMASMAAAHRTYLAYHRDHVFRHIPR